MGVEVALDVGRARPGRGACLRAPPSARRGPRAAPARCRRSRGARRPRASVSQVSTSPLSVSVMPCSETERPRATASSRSCTLWAWEPVKCWSRLPKAAGGTIRRSTETPLWVWARTPLGPGLPAAAISGWAARCSASAAGSSAVAIRSMSLQVSAQRRTEPATSTRLAAGCSRSAAASSSAIGFTFESSRRPGPSPGSPRRSSAARMFSSAFGPSPLTSRIFSPSAAALRSSIEEISSSSKSRRAVFGADPGDAGHLDQGRRELRLQLHRGGDLAGLDQRVDLFRQRLADAGDLGRLAPRRQLGDRDRALADRLGGGAVGEDAVFDRPVELVEDPQLFQGGGDLGVRHLPRNTIAGPTGRESGR